MTRKLRPETEAVQKYEGPLAEPLYAPTMLSSIPDTIFSYALERANRTLLLFSHFGIDPCDERAWRSLAIALANRHVPGFRPPPRKQGRPKENDDVLLWMRVELLK